MRYSRAGFGLIELMIVVGVIMLIAGIAIPNMQRAKHNANEAAAMSFCKTIGSACENFRIARGRYPDDLADLTDAVPAFLYSPLEDDTKYGYNYGYNSASPYHFDLSATPITSGVTGTRTFTVDESGQVQIAAATASEVGDEEEIEMFLSNLEVFLDDEEDPDPDMIIPDPPPERPPLISPGPPRR